MEINFKPLGNQIVKKFEYKDLLSNTKVIMNLGYEAIVYQNYLLYKQLKSGISILNEYKSKKKVTDKATYTIYLVNKNKIMSNNWSLPYPVDYYDKELGSNVMLYAAGAYKYSILDPKALIELMMGDKDALDNNEIYHFFKEIVSEEVRELIANEAKTYNYFELCQRQSDVAIKIKTNLTKKLKEYGLMLNEFNILGYVPKPEWIIEQYRIIKFEKTKELIK